MTAQEARTLRAALPLAAHALLRAVCAALGHHPEPTTTTEGADDE